MCHVTHLSTHVHTYRHLEALDVKKAYTWMGHVTHLNTYVHICRHDVETALNERFCGIFMSHTHTYRSLEARDVETDCT